MRFYESENQMNLIEVGAGEVDGLCRVDEIDVFLQSYLLLCSYSPHSSSSIFLFSLSHVCCWRKIQRLLTVKFKFQNQRRREFVIFYEKTDLPLHYVTARRRVCYWLRKDGLTPFFFLSNRKHIHILIIHIFSFKTLRK